MIDQDFQELRVNEEYFFCVHVDKLMKEVDEGSWCSLRKESSLFLSKKIMVNL